MVKHLKDAFAPNNVISRQAMGIIIWSWVSIMVIYWMFFTSAIIPKPSEVLRAFGGLWTQEGLGYELWISIWTNLQALTITALISLGLSYLTVLPVVRPAVEGISKLRFASMAGLIIVFTLIFSGGHSLKVSLLVFGMTVFFVTQMAEEVANIPKEEFDHARTLRMGEWRAVWEVIVIGKLSVAIEILRQNAAMGWMMLTMVEGLVRSEGGVGALLLNERKHFNYDAVFAIQLAILLVGIAFDYGFGLIKEFLCPYASLKLERR